jgi:hypothetical protein
MYLANLTVNLPLWFVNPDLDRRLSRLLLEYTYSVNLFAAEGGTWQEMRFAVRPRLDQDFYAGSTGSLDVICWSLR